MNIRLWMRHRQWTEWGDCLTNLLLSPARLNNSWHNVFYFCKTSSSSPESRTKLEVHARESVSPNCQSGCAHCPSPCRLGCPVFYKSCPNFTIMKYVGIYDKIVWYPNFQRFPISFTRGATQVYKGKYKGNTKEIFILIQCWRDE